MTTFDDREKDFEARYKHDQELQFKVKARRNRLLGMWAAGKMGLSGDAPIVEPEPGAAGQPVEAGDDFRPVGPMAARRQRRAVDHLVAVGADDDRPRVLWPAQDHERAHSGHRQAARRL